MKLDDTQNMDNIVELQTALKSALRNYGGSGSDLPEGIKLKISPATVDLCIKSTQTALSW